MTKLFVLPTEPQPMQYCQQWLNWFEKKLRKNKIPYMVVKGDQWAQQLSKGDVFDPIATSHWKLTQIDNLVKLIRSGKVKSGDVIFDFDLWHHGLEAIAYIKALKKLDLRIYGLLHAGTSDETDFTFQSGMEYFGKHVELGWINIAEKVFVASNYHAEILTKERGVSNVAVTGLPIDFGIQKFRKRIREEVVVWTSRIAPEKRYDKYQVIMERVQKLRPFVKFVSTHERGLDKKSYYKLLGEAKVVLSTAEQETFGIGTVEGMILGAVPVVPDGLSYTDYVPDECRYQDIDSAVIKIMHSLDNGGDYSEYVRKYESAFEEMLKRMELL